MKKRYFSFILLLLIIVMTAGNVTTVSAWRQAEYPDSYFEGRTWDEVLEQFLKEHNAISGTVGLGYKNLVTGEEHYYEGDKLFLSASTYKLPLNMYWSNKIYTGELDWDFKVCGLEYEKAQQMSIVNSNNEYSIGMWQMIGDFTTFRKTMLPLIGETEDTVPELFYKNNYFTTKQLTFCLEELYNNSEKYPRVLEYMLVAKPNQYFKDHEHDVEIAHKFGYLDEENYVINDCGIVYTEDPIAITCLTWNAHSGYYFLVDYCDLTIAYTKYHTAIRKEEEAAQAAAEAERAAAEAAAEAEKAALQAALDEARTQRLAVFSAEADSLYSSLEEAFSPAVQAFETGLRSIMTDPPQEEAEEEQDDRSMAMYMAAAAAALAGVAALTVTLLRRGGMKIVGILGSLALFAAAGFTIAFVPVRTPEPEPVYLSAPEVVLSELSQRGEYNGSEDSRKVYDYLTGGFSCFANTAAEPVGNLATLELSGTTVDAGIFKGVILENVNSELYSLQEELSKDDCSLNEDEILQRVGEIFTNALNGRTAAASACSVEFSTDVKLIYSEDTWHIIYDETLLNTLCARTAE